MMFMLGFILLGTTLLLPLFTQTMLGYTAEKAGLALMPGGLVILASMPIVGFLLGRTDPRRIMIFGLCMLTAALFYMTNFDLQIDFKTAALATMRALQMPEGTELAKRRFAPSSASEAAAIWSEVPAQ